jgi:hypothetical protein
MTQDNTRLEWEAHCVTFAGERIEWRGLRHRQAKWRYDRLRAGMLWQGKSLKACGYAKAGEA